MQAARKRYGNKKTAEVRPDRSKITKWSTCFFKDGKRATGWRCRGWRRSGRDGEIHFKSTVDEFHDRYNGLFAIISKVEDAGRYEVLIPSAGFREVEPDH